MRIGYCTTYRSVGIMKNILKKAVHPRRTRQHIIKAAKSLFAKKGYSNTSMEEIADTIGVQKASLYYFFKNKEEIFLDIILGGFGELRRFFSEVTSAMPLQKFIESYIKLCVKNSVVVRMIDSRVMSTAMKKRVINEVLEMKREIVKVLRNHRVFRPEFATQILADSVFAYVLHCNFVNHCPVSSDYSRYLASLIKQKE